MNDKIILMGFMGCGKSTVGRELAKRLDYQFIDLDDEIEKVARTTISKIFEFKGESYFRKLESKTLKSVLAKKGNIVIALGGGTPCYGENIKFINNYPSYYIKCGVDVLTKRLKKERSHRPIIAEQNTGELKNFIKQKLQERSLFYEKADHVLVGARSVTDICSRIIQLQK